MQKNTILRTPETYAAYHNHPGRTAEKCFICDAPVVRNFWLWKIIKNDFPYDKAASEHMMLVPKRHIAQGREIHSAERLELDHIKDEFNLLDTYDCVIENLAAGRTFMPHYHLHLIKWKRV